MACSLYGALWQYEKNKDSHTSGIFRKDLRTLFHPCLSTYPDPGEILGSILLKESNNTLFFFHTVRRKGQTDLSTSLMHNGIFFRLTLGEHLKAVRVAMKEKRKETLSEMQILF